jgi:fermentation-respiration switch protein FrsA (DUF1100 family)
MLKMKRASEGFIIFSSRLLFVALVFNLCGCSSLFYYPSRDVFYKIEDLKAHAETVRFSGANGVSLSGLYLAPPEIKAAELLKRPIVVQFHGNAQNLTSHFASLYWLLGYGYDYFIFDYEGYGASEGRPSPQNTVQDGLAALDWVQKKFPGRPMVVVGQSLGGAVAMRAVIDSKNRYPIALLVIESSFDSYRAIASDVLSRSWITWLFQPLAYVFVSNAEAPGDRIGEISPIPMLIIHGKKDPIVPYRFGERIFTAAREPKEFWSYETPGHVIAYEADGGALRKKFLEKLRRLSR